MDISRLSVREIREDDIEHIIHYWYDAQPGFLTAMGVDLSKMPPPEALKNYLTEPLLLPYHQKATYCIIWLAGDEAIGHCNVNKIIFGEEAYMHLHLWNPQGRKKGFGTSLVPMTL